MNIANHSVKVVGVFVLLCIFTVTGFGQDLYPTLGARSVGMGTVSTAVMRGAEALYWNPAAIAWDEGWSIAGSFTMSSPDTKEQFFAATYSPFEESVLGVGFHRQKKINVDGIAFGFILGYASTIVENQMALGITFQTFESQNGTNGFRLSLGMQYRPYKSLTFGTVVLSRHTYGDEANEIRVPFHAKTGFMYSPVRWIALAVDWELSRISSLKVGRIKEDGELVRMNYGIELTLPMEIFWSEGKEVIDIKFRGGTKSGITEAIIEGEYYHWKHPWDEGGLSIGCGVELKSISPKIALNIAVSESRSYIGGFSVRF